MSSSSYTVQKIAKADYLYGPVHGSDTGNETLCGQETSYDWYILTTRSDGTITCKKCLKILNTPNPQKRGKGQLPFLERGGLES